MSGTIETVRKLRRVDQKTRLVNAIFFFFFYYQIFSFEGRKQSRTPCWLPGRSEMNHHVGFAVIGSVRLLQVPSDNSQSWVLVSCVEVLYNKLTMCGFFSMGNLSCLILTPGDPVNKIWWLYLVPTSTTRFAKDVGYRMVKNLVGLYTEIIFMNNNI